ncbi:MAG TPA: arylesterase [Burkholderiaceae bacterium]|nr:arylesterase [Burkholderiaceae bacterium]
MSDRRRFIVASLLTLVSSLVGPPAAATQNRPSNTSRNTPGPAEADSGTAHRSILVVGDSLSAEYGLPAGTGWVTHIDRHLEQHGTGYQIHNASISGDTTSGGVSRLPGELDRSRPDIVIIELGANDALRGLSLDMARDNLAQMIEMSQQHGARVLLIGMQIPPNYGKRYADQFAALFPELATRYDTGLVPFMLDGFATDPDMFLDDGIHPNEAAQALIAETVWSLLVSMLDVQ